jgi:uncharacterized membrane protein YfcA
VSLLSELNWVYTLSGFAVGFLVGITGVGGGSLMTPILILLFGIAPVTAVGTDLLYACVTKAGGVTVHGFNKNIDWKVVRRLSAGSIPASALTVLVLYLLNVHSAASNALFVAALATALLLTAIVLTVRGRFIGFYRARIGQPDDVHLRCYTAAVGVALGVLVSISSVGAGALGATALILLYPELPAAKIAGSDIAHAVPLTLVAGLGHLLLGTIDFGLLISLLVGSLPGILISSALVTKIPERMLRYILATILTIVAARLASSVLF